MVMDLKKLLKIDILAYIHSLKHYSFKSFMDTNAILSNLTVTTFCSVFMLAF